MRYLLDTHTFLWWAGEDPQLPARVRVLLEDPANEVFFSASSAWEIAIKVRLGRLQFAGDPEQLIPRQMAAGRFRALPVEIRHALRVAALPLLHRDPFDRLLVAQSQVEDLSILTGDPIIGRYGVAVAW